VTESGAPTVAILSPEDGAIGYADLPLMLLGSASDDIDDAELLVATWESDLDCELGTAALDSDGTTGLDTTLSAGTHTLTLWVEDTLGKLGSDAVTLQVFETNTDPACAIALPLDGATGYPGEAVAFEATVSDAEDAVEDLVATWSSDLDGELGGGSPDADGLLTDSFTDLSQGTHVLTLAVVDTGGGSCESSVGYTVGAPPEITLVAPSDGAVFNQGAAVTFEATVVDDADSGPDLSIAWESDLDGSLSTAGADGGGHHHLHDHVAVDRRPPGHAHRDRHRGLRERRGAHRGGEHPADRPHALPEPRPRDHHRQPRGLDRRPQRRRRG
jgi:hypothetical protein